MFSVFMELVKRVGIFIIIGQTILHFGISKQYEKYMKLVICFMIAAQIVFAFGMYLGQDEWRGYLMSGEEYLEKWNVGMIDVEEGIEKSRVEMVQNFEEELQQSKPDIADENEKNSIKIEKIVIR